MPPDPDNVPPLSRLFIVVPKTADGAAIEVSLQSPCLQQFTRQGSLLSFHPKEGDVATFRLCWAAPLKAKNSTPSSALHTKPLRFTFLAVIGTGELVIGFPGSLPGEVVFAFLVAM